MAEPNGNAIGRRGRRRRVVITGIGPVTGFGVGIDPLWDGLCEGRSAIRRIRAFDATPFTCQVAAELDPEAYDIRKIVPKSYRKATKVMCRDIELAVVAAAAAVTDAGLTTRAVDPDVEPTYPPGRFGCQIGAGLISADVDELAAALVTSRREDGTLDIGHWGATGMHHLTPLWLLKYLPNMLACHVTIVHDIRGPSNTITCCESSSALSVGESLRVIQRGAADACLTGGAEHRLNIMTFYRQLCTGRLAPANGEADPAATVRPYDPAATGTVLGEGGGILVLEEYDAAAARGASIYADVAGFAATQSPCPDTVGITLPEDDPSLIDAIEIALANAGVERDQVDAIVPVGSGIPAIDRAEAHAIRSVFGDRAASIPLVTTIPNVGNCGAGNSAVSLAVAARCLREQRLPARLNTRGADGLDANATAAREARLDTILVLSAGLGGQNAAVVLQRA